MVRVKPTLAAILSVLLLTILCATGTGVYAKLMVIKSYPTGPVWSGLQTWARYLYGFSGLVVKHPFYTSLKAWSAKVLEKAHTGSSFMWELWATQEWSTLLFLLMAVALVVVQGYLIVQLVSARKLRSQLQNMEGQKLQVQEESARQRQALEGQLQAAQRAATAAQEETAQARAGQEQAVAAAAAARQAATAAHEQTAQARAAQEQAEAAAVAAQVAAAAHGGAAQARAAQEQAVAAVAARQEATQARAAERQAMATAVAAQQATTAAQQEAAQARASEMQAVAATAAAQQAATAAQESAAQARADQAQALAETAAARQEATQARAAERQAVATANTAQAATTAAQQEATRARAAERQAVAAIAAAQKAATAAQEAAAQARTAQEQAVARAAAAQQAVTAAEGETAQAREAERAAMERAAAAASGTEGMAMARAAAGMATFKGTVTGLTSPPSPKLKPLADLAGCQPVIKAIRSHELVDLANLLTDEQAMAISNLPGVEYDKNPTVDGRAANLMNARKHSIAVALILLAHMTAEQALVVIQFLSGDMVSGGFATSCSRMVRKQVQCDAVLTPIFEGVFGDVHVHNNKRNAAFLVVSLMLQHAL